MQLDFEELKTLYRSLYVNVDDLVVSKQDAAAEELKRSVIAWNRLELLSWVAAEICRFRPIPF